MADSRICKWCGGEFTPHPKAHWQVTCGKAECKVKQRRYENTKEVTPRVELPKPRRFSVTVQKRSIGDMVMGAGDFLRGRVQRMDVPKSCRAIVSLVKIRKFKKEWWLTYQIGVEKIPC